MFILVRALNFLGTVTVSLVQFSEESLLLPATDIGKTSAYIIFDWNLNWLNQLSEHNRFIPFDHWFFNMTKNEVPADLRLQLNSQFFTFSPQEIDSNNEIINVYEAYKIADDKPVIQNSIGQWSFYQGFAMTDIPIWQRRSNLSGLIFRGVIGEDQPYTTIIRKHDNISSFVGMSSDLIQDLQSRLHFKYENLYY
jgi:hypothetical protein